MGKLIISYDCEGVWGMLDHMNDLDQSVFNKNTLIQIYQELLKIHEEYQLNATFAFVGAFIMSSDEFASHVSEHPNAKQAIEWLESIISKENKFKEEDLFIPDLIKLIKNSNLDHEIASHGFSHVIMDNNIDQSSIKFEIEGISKTAQKHEIDIETIIFPRNIVNYNFLMRANFIKAFRDAPYNPFKIKFFKRAYSLIKEFSPITKSQQLNTVHKKIVIPGDFFINWRSGARKLIPISLTVSRFRRAIKHAIKNDGIVHIWLHPHNLATGDNQFILLKKLLDEVKYFSTRGPLEVITQRDIVNLNKIS